MDIISLLNTNSGAIQGISTIVLVLITAFYALQTYKANKLIYRQVMPKVALNVIELKSILLNKEHVQEIDEHLEKSFDSLFSIRFSLVYSTVNQSASFGTIEKPELILTCRKTKRQLIISCAAAPISTGSLGKPGDSPNELLAVYKLCEMEGICNNVVYLRPGERRDREDIFYRGLLCKEPDSDLLYFIHNPIDVDYSISYIDENGEKKYLPIEDEKISPMSFK